MPRPVHSKLKAERIQETLKTERIQSKLEAPRLVELLAEVPAWEVGEDGRSLRRVYRFPTSRIAALFAQLATEVGEAAGHQPDVHLRGRQITLTVAGGEGVAESHFQLPRSLAGRA